MELYQLRSFVTVAHEGHLTRAAKRLYISQPAVSAHIKALEEELGVSLFARTPQGMQLTREGHLLKAQAEKSLSAIDELFQQAKQLQDDLVGSVKIGLNMAPEFLRVVEFCAAMHANYPKVEIHFMQRSSLQTLDAIHQETLDAGFVFGEHSYPDILILPLHTVTLVVVGPAQWNDRLQQADWPDLAEFPWIWGLEQCPYYRPLSALFQRIGRNPVKAVTAEDDLTLKALAASGIGLAVLVEDEARAAEREGSLVVWKKHSFHTSLALAYSQKHADTPVMQAVLNGIVRAWDLS
jgi:DNA-binding transcriptional LysR family regulator